MAEYKTITILNIGKITIDIENISKCRLCQRMIHWGITTKPAYIPLDYNNGNWQRHKCKPQKYDDRLQDFNEQKKRDRWK